MLLLLNVFLCLYITWHRIQIKLSSCYNQDLDSPIILCWSLVSCWFCPSVKISFLSRLFIPQVTLSWYSFISCRAHILWCSAIPAWWFLCTCRWWQCFIILRRCLNFPDQCALSNHLGWNRCLRGKLPCWNLVSCKFCWLCSIIWWSCLRSLKCNFLMWVNLYWITVYGVKAYVHIKIKIEFYVLVMQQYICCKCNPW